MKAVAISKRIIDSHKRGAEARKEKVIDELKVSNPTKADIQEWLDKQVEKKLTSEV
ncbi:hypothetical protein M1146_05770 [Patescibacteria group bacterium]|nr:hypothetical protein [Patescibacteria group bacterium]